MQRTIRLFIVLACLLSARLTTAHFLWLDFQPADKPTQVNLWFSETCVPGEAKLLEKVSHAKAWAVQHDGTTTSLTLEKHLAGETGAWCAALEAPPPPCVEATCDYGVVSRGGDTFLLQYHARHMALDSADDLGSVPVSKPLPLDVSSSADGGALVFQIRYDGKPAPGALLLVILPSNEERELKLDANGACRLEGAEPGPYAIRARMQVHESGQRDGKQYDDVRHYTTLTFRLPGTRTAELAAVVPAATGDAQAAELLRRARASRAVWNDFAGFTAEVTVTIDGRTQQGTVEVDDSGASSVQVADEALKNWAEEVVDSLVQHRLPSSFGDDKPTFADEEMEHPLGRKILLGDAEYQSAYRIRDDMITEVNRRAGPTHFTISVLQTELNPEKKYLPRIVSMTTWDESNQVRSSSTVLTSWSRVGNFDVPQRMLEVQTGPGTREVRQITFSNYRLNAGTESVHQNEVNAPHPGPLPEGEGDVVRRSKK